MAVLTPPVILSENATPIAIPSATLWIVSPIMIFHATDEIVFLTSPFSFTSENMFELPFSNAIAV